jgi:hypothetical protein
MRGPAESERAALAGSPKSQGRAEPHQSIEAAPLIKRENCVGYSLFAKPRPTPLRASPSREVRDERSHEN